MKHLFFILFLCIASIAAHAQTDSSTATTQTAPRTLTRGDSLMLARTNSTGNILIAAGVGLCGAGGYLVYNGYKVYTTSIDPKLGASQQQEAERQNHKQGTIYMAVGGVCIAGGIICTALGAKNKVEFKRMKKYMQQQPTTKAILQGGWLDSGNLGLALTF